MRYKLYIVLGLCLMVSCLPAAGQRRNDVLLGDSAYRHVLRNGKDSLNCYLAYRQGSYEVMPGFGNNDAELSRLDAFVRRAFADTLIYVRQVSLTGYCSIEGTYGTNERLAQERVNGMKHYLDSEYRLGRRYPMMLDYVAEDWETLRKLIDSSMFPWREEVLAIIDRVGIFDGRESLLMKLDGGTPYREMQTELFPKLRRVEVKVEYDLRRIIETRYQRKMSDEEFLAILQEERQKAAALEKRLSLLEKNRQPAPQATTKKQAVTKKQAATKKQSSAPKPAKQKRVHKEFYPLVGLKTNLVSWAGVTPELERATYMPNLALEVFFANRWSAVLSGTFADFDFGRGYHWGVSAYSFEPRFWWKSGGKYTGFYVGLYGTAGDFNSRRKEGQFTGTYLQGGVSLGYYLPITPRWGLEVGARGGYHKADADQYETHDNAYYRMNTEVDADRLGLMGLNVSVSYRF